MPTQEFEIESYDLTAYPRSGTTYQILLTSTPLFHNRRDRANIFFRPALEEDDIKGYVIGLSTFEDVIVYVWADEKYFDSMYHILQTENPVSFRFRYPSGTRSSRYLDSFSLSTADEPTGEGLSEMALHSLVSAGEVDLDEVDAEQLGVEDIESLLRTEAPFDTEQTDE